MKIFFIIVLLIVILIIVILRNERKKRKTLFEDSNYVEPTVIEDIETDETH